MITNYEIHCNETSYAEHCQDHEHGYFLKIQLVSHQTAFCWTDQISRNPRKNQFFQTQRRTNIPDRDLSSPKDKRKGKNTWSCCSQEWQSARMHTRGKCRPEVQPSIGDIAIRGSREEKKEGETAAAGVTWCRACVACVRMCVCVEQTQRESEENASLAGCGTIISRQGRTALLSHTPTHTHAHTHCPRDGLTAAGFSGPRRRRFSGSPAARDAAAQRSVGRQFRAGLDAGLSGEGVFWLTGIFVAGDHFDHPSSWFL